MKKDELIKEAYEYYGVSTLEEVYEKAAKNIEVAPTGDDYYYKGLANRFFEKYEEAIDLNPNASYAQENLKIAMQKLKEQE